jgi:hypothetical protein
MSKAILRSVFPDQGVNFMQQAGKSLNLVHNNPTVRRPRLDLLPKRLRLATEREQCLRP